MIEAEGVFAGYGGRDVLSGVSLTARPGEIVGVLGPNGAGKSTLLAVLSGILRPRSGGVRLAGRDVFALGHAERARGLSMVPQRTDAAFGPLVRSVVLMGRFAHSPGIFGYGPDDRAAAEEAMAEAGVAHLADRPVSELSGGEQKRVFIARALAQRAAVMLFDEAASGLDPARAVEIHDLLARKCRQGAAVILTIHDLNLAALYCDRMIFLKQGRVSAAGPTKDVFTKDVISRVYETTPVLVDHPLAGVAQALFVPGSGSPA
jgi:iron complex transport system ATP-binding protein